MKRRTKIVIASAAMATAVAAGTGAAIAAGGDTDTPITGEALEKASSAALEHMGEGRVTDTEVGDEESFYEVEVTLGDGSQVDVQLDERFNVVSSAADDESADDND